MEVTQEGITNLLLEVKQTQLGLSDAFANYSLLTEIVVPEDISSIYNQFDIIFNHLQNLKNKINEQQEVVNKTDLIMNLLNYRMYEIQYEFVTQIDELIEKRKEIKQSSANESQKALQIVNIDKEITDYNDAHHQVFQSIKQQKLDAQDIYEKSIYILDNYLDSVKRYFNEIILLFEAEKAHHEIEDLPHILLIDDLDKDINMYTRMQSKGWRNVVTKNISDIPGGLKITEDGLLITESGKHITYEETKEHHLLDYLEMFDYVKSKSKIVLEETPSESKASTLESTMSMEDINYLKKYLGVPLTMALAEITTVQPKDPIHYLGHWLFKYRYNQEYEEMQKIEIEHLTEERNRLATERWHKFVEDEARAAVIEIILRAEHQAMENELRRIAMALEAEEENEQQQNLEDEARDKFENY